MKFNPSKIFLLYPNSFKKEKKVLKQIQTFNLKAELISASDLNQEKMLMEIQKNI